MSLGAHSLGAFYLGGAPRFETAQQITGTADCVLQSATCSATGRIPIRGTAACALKPATCSATGTVPERVEPQTITLGGGVFPVPLRKRPRRIVAITRCVGPVASCALTLKGRHRHKASAVAAIAGPQCASAATLTAPEDDEIYALALATMDDPGARFGVLLDRRWR